MENFNTCSDGVESEVSALKNQDLCSKMSCTQEPSIMQNTEVVLVRENQMDGGSRWHEQDRQMPLRQMCQVLDWETVLEMRIRQCMRVKYAKRLWDLCMFVVYIIALYCTVLSITDPAAFYSTRSYKNVIVNVDTFTEATSVEMIISYLSELLIPALHQEEIYNYDRITETGVTPLYDTKLLGLVRIRQLRVKNGTCRFAMEVRDLRGTCSREFSLSTQDTGNYGISWSPFDAVSSKVERRRVPWIYLTAWESGTLPMIGEFAFYPGGGYVATLGRTRKNSLAVLEFLTHNSWFDEHTRAIFIDFTLYTADTNIFSVFKLMVEISAVGTVFSSYDITTAALLMNYHKLGLSVLVPAVICFLMLCVFTVQQIRLCHSSVRSYFTSWYEVLDVIIIFLGFIAGGTYIFCNYYLSQLIKTLEEKDDNEFVNFMWVAYCDNILLYILAILVGLSTVRLLKILQFGNQFCALERSLTSVFETLSPLTLPVLTITAAFAVIAYALIGGSDYGYSKISYCISAVFFYAIGVGELGYEKFFIANSVAGLIFVSMVWVFFIVFLLNICTSVVSSSYESAQKELSLVHEEYTMRDYLSEQKKYYFNR